MATRNGKVRTLIVDDNPTWRLTLTECVACHAEMEIVGEAVDGLEAVRCAQKLHPDLVLLDIGLPNLNGIEAARRIAKISPQSKILFVTENRDPDIVQEALSSGSRGYLFKANVASDLPRALDTVLAGEVFVSTRGDGSQAESGVQALPDPRSPQ